jgi:hypothetical protein
MSFLVYLGLGHVVAWVLLYQHPGFWARTDNKAIREDGSQDSLHDKFHRQRLATRAVIIHVIALLCSLPAWGHWNYLLSSFATLSVLGWALFGVRFNPQLSLARGLPEWYVSFGSDPADFPDGYLAQKARTRFPLDSLVKQQLYASRLLQDYTEGAEIGLCLFYLVAVGLTLWLA